MRDMFPRLFRSRRENRFAENLEIIRGIAYLGEGKRRVLSERPESIFLSFEYFVPGYVLLYFCPISDLRDETVARRIEKCRSIGDELYPR